VRDDARHQPDTVSSRMSHVTGVAALQHPALVAHSRALGRLGADVGDGAVRAAQAAPAVNLQQEHSTHCQRCSL
jgi:hypothetical protein